ncbi:hypothetical protein HBH56_031810 [Parastagonospora nodorum]|uniref:Uncharacterized protein n=1 Tax=Phaeosphaeria nodorum (strain SN15 / ATCC MYA-4574 / FGSC 10173) TaxID=321614 RepID=A0A7U2I3E8_PHANO|nr:hypothetical protein HBH56_031810 [Parastagonospora nodorum]QRD00380.1 hypothetical protein JI435_305130 [Parastagonospora nodorum SN15]KAH3933921.1 hypothetical protein HBH54_067640 [Parastagonospora nodorum]KAH4001820.1 hypothetical protein HBI10_084660 [Parastagonospora nodorum]KAH4031627.1 hypothetical protein HBI13_013490 [Parastagonospora nodorum]
MRFVLVVLLGLLLSVRSDVSAHHVDAAIPDSSQISNLIFPAHVARPGGENSTVISHKRRWNGPPPAPAADDVWEKMKCKGRKFMAQMSYSDFDAGQMLPVPQNTAQSPWYLAHLYSWAYVISSVGEVYRSLGPGGYWGVSDFFRHISISDKCVEEGGKWIAAVITHYQQGTLVDGQRYTSPNGEVKRASGAYFYMAVNPQGGIIVQNTLGPREAANKVYPGNYPDTELPALQKLSDMMWMMWEYYVPAAQRTNLDFVMSLSISNPTSLSIIRRAFDSQGQVLTATPYKFDPNSDGGLALLGSPNGARVAHFLIQRKPQVGLKTVIGIYGFESQAKSRAPCLMFKLGNLAAATPRPPVQRSELGPSSGAEQNMPVEETSVKRVLEQRNFVRTHIFRFDGNVTLPSEYM